MLGKREILYRIAELENNLFCLECRVEEIEDKIKREGKLERAIKTATKKTTKKTTTKKSTSKTKKVK